MKLFRAGDHIVCGENVYGGTLPPVRPDPAATSGSRSRYVDTRDPQRIADAMTPATRVRARRDADESADAHHRPRAPSAEIAHARATRCCIVDNTFATPFFQRPLEFGADIVYHSTTKYLNGH